MDAYVGHCYAVVTNVVAQRTVGGITFVDVEIENIRPRWYEVSIVAGEGAARRVYATFYLAPAQSRFADLFSKRRKAYRRTVADLPLLPGAPVEIAVNGSTDGTSIYLGADILMWAFTGKPLPNSALELTTNAGFGAVSLLGGYLGKGSAFGKALADKSAWGVMNALSGLAGDVAANPELAKALAGVLGMNVDTLTTNLLKLSSWQWAFKGTMVAATAINHLASPRFDAVRIEGS